MPNNNDSTSKTPVPINRKAVALGIVGVGILTAGILAYLKIRDQATLINYMIEQLPDSETSSIEAPLTD